MPVTHHKQSIALASLVVMMLITGCLVEQEKPITPSKQIQQSSLSLKTYVGRQACVDCHAKQDQLWQGSHHKLAMQIANDKTVLGDFADAEFNYQGVLTRFFKTDDHFYVNTDGPDGELADFEIKYTFGVEPLQQYLIEFTGGRLQAFSIAWDNRPQEKGGQRWFHLYPNESIDFTHEMHWTKRLQNWNFMCAECHSTNLQKNYNPLDRTYDTSWSDINVACEACHGPASHHVIWAKRGTGFEQIDNDTKGLAIHLDASIQTQRKADTVSHTAKIDPLRNTNSNLEIQVCAHCHSRRIQLFTDFRHGSLFDSHLPSLLQSELYHVDGQIKEEVYEYGSFLQSKMFQAGVTCSNCHEPHSLELRAPGNQVCMQCHAADHFDTETHHFHSKGKEGSYCVDCHMPTKTYMQIDDRHDHQFSVPRPDLSEQLGTPNACSGCHTSKTPQWAVDKVREWYGRNPEGYQNFSETLHAIRTNALDTFDYIMRLQSDQRQPIIARATAIEEIDLRINAGLFNVLVNALYDSDPMMRIAGLNALTQLPPGQRWLLAHDLLQDPTRSIRAIAASSLAETSTDSMSAHEKLIFEQATDDYLSSLSMNEDDPGAQVSLGNFYSARDKIAQAEQAYREALYLDANSIPAYINYADMLRKLNRDIEGEALLQEGLARNPTASALHHSLGLLQVRKKDLSNALISLKKAAELAPSTAQYSYIYAVALYNSGQVEAAQSIVNSALIHAPNDPVLIRMKAQLADQK